MGKKKQKPNAFSVFMFEFLQREKERGKSYPREQWSSVAAPHYHRLTEAEKQRYKQKASQMPDKVFYTAPKYTSQGILLSEVDRKQRLLVEQKAYMERKIRNMIENAFIDNDIKTKSFNFIMAQTFYESSEGSFSPAEIAVAKFSFQEGVYKIYHTYVNPEIVTIGYAYTAKANSEKYHRLPPPPNAKGEKNFGKIYSAILDVVGAQPGERFDKDDDRRPCVFILHDQGKMIKSVLDQLSEMNWQRTFDVFDLEYLFFVLKNKVKSLTDADTGEWPISATSQFIEADRYDTTADISCAFHEQEDATRYCALSCVRRWFFLFADHICKHIGITPIPGKHVPKNAAVDEQPLAPFDDDPLPAIRDDYESRANARFEDDRKSHVSSVTGYSRFEQDLDSSSSDE